MELEFVSKTTWKPDTDLTKTEIRLVYDALAQSSDREKEMRRMIHFPAEHESVFATLIERVNDVFDKPARCPSANYKNDCYKELKRILNEFQRSLRDSGEPVRFTLKRTKPTTPIPRPTTSTTTTPTTTATTTSTTTSPTTTTTTTTPRPRPISHNGPAPLSRTTDNLIYNMPDWQIESFAKMILECKTVDERTKFIKKYVYVLNENDEPFPEMVDDIIVDLVDICDNSSQDDAVEEHLKYLKKMHTPSMHTPSMHTPSMHTPSIDTHLKIYILYPFPVMYPKVYRGHKTRRTPNVRNLGGGKRRQTKRRTKPIKPIKPKYKMKY